MSLVPKVSKVAMKNIIGSVKIHNRIVEEDECWRQRRLELSRKRKSYTNTRTVRGKPVENKPQAHMDHSHKEKHVSYHEKVSTSCNWTKLYHKIESSCSDRWGHAGYKELYPEQFLSTDDESEHKIMQPAESIHISCMREENDDDLNINLRKQPKRARSQEGSPALKKKKKCKSSDSKKHRKKKLKKRSSSESSSSSLTTDFKKKKNRKTARKKYEEE